MSPSAARFSRLIREPPVGMFRDHIAGPAFRKPIHSSRHVIAASASADSVSDECQQAKRAAAYTLMAMAVRGAGLSKAMLSSTTPANRPPAASAASSML